jgi:hypothetical protein
LLILIASRDAKTCCHTYLAFNHKKILDEKFYEAIAIVTSGGCQQSEEKSEAKKASVVN